ncbi:thermonuclease family protein [Candidatus Methylomirabilis sp.]
MYEGRVVGVSDGDTITVLMGGHKQIKVRLAEIDAPEKSQAFGQRSKQSLSDMIFGKSVRVEQRDVDRYGRVVGRVFIGGTDVNAEQVRQGMAWVYRQYLRDTTLLTVEKEAREARRGLWSDPHPVPPWEYRHGDRGKSVGVDAPLRLGREARDGESARQCGAKQYCSQMTSCEEARYYLTQCGISSLDRDGDGVPCEALCGARR